MIWKQKGGAQAPPDAVALTERAAQEFSVPAGILLGTIECESNFRLGLVSSAGAVGPCQFKRKFAADYYRYAGFAFDLEGWESVRGMAAIYAYYAQLGAKRHGFAGVDRWRYALAAHRWGQNSAQAKTLSRAGRITDVEEAMRRNGVWYEEEAKMADTKLSEHFALSEFYDPANYADVLKGRAAPTVKAADIDPRIVQLLELIREQARKKWPGAVITIRPHGGYRPDPLNALVGGAAGSQHRKGNAADFSIVAGGKKVNAAHVAVWAERWMADAGVKGGVGMYHAGDNYIHVDARGKNVHWYASYSSNGCPGQGGVPCVYRTGTKGAGVCLIQRVLGLTPDGKFGKQTAAALKKWQSAHGLQADGVYGAATNRAMGGLLPW